MCSDKFSESCYFDAEKQKKNEQKQTIQLTMLCVYDGDVHDKDGKYGGDWRTLYLLHS